MEGHVTWMTELSVKDGQLDAFRELMEEMVEDARSEPGALAYTWYISDDGGTVHILETYADSEAMIAHANRFLEQWARRYMGCVTVTRFVVHGDPSPEARSVLDGWRAVYLAPWGGFSRFA